MFMGCSAAATDFIRPPVRRDSSRSGIGVYNPEPAGITWSAVSSASAEGSSVSAALDADRNMAARVASPPDPETEGRIGTQISTHLSRSEGISAEPRSLSIGVHDLADPLRTISEDFLVHY
jgi:hypothetical protein